MCIHKAHFRLYQARHILSLLHSGMVLKTKYLVPSPLSCLSLVLTNSPVFTPPGYRDHGYNGTNNTWTPPLTINSASLLEWSMDCVVSRIPKESLSVLHCGAQPGIIPQIGMHIHIWWLHTLTLIVDLLWVYRELTHLFTIGSYTPQLWRITTSGSVGLFTTRLVYMSALGDYWFQLYRIPSWLLRVIPRYSGMWSWTISYYHYSNGTVKN